MVTQEDIEALAGQLRRESYEQHAQDLAGAYEGVFSGTELYMKWRALIRGALSERGLSPALRADAERIVFRLDDALR